MPAPQSPTEVLTTALQLKSSKNMAQQSSAQALMCAIQSKTPAKSMPSAQILINAIQPKIVAPPAQNTTAQSVCEPASPKNGSRNAMESSRALKELLVISTQTTFLTPSKLTYSQSLAGTSPKIDDKPTVAESKVPVKESCTVNQKEKKSKLTKERSKSRSNSEDADFYAGSAILNSPNPNVVPLPDFDESYDFFSAETQYHMVKPVRLNLVR